MSTPLNDPLFVVARNYQQFQDWCRRKGYDPAGRHVRYVRGVDTLMGQRDIRILFLHNWVDRSDARAVYNRAMIVGRRPG